MAHPNQFGFRKGRRTAMACNYLNDLSLYCKSKGSPLYICSLDAEKCFDTIWHEGLSTNCSIFYLVHIGFFSINGTNPWNASFDGMALVANLLMSIEVPDRVVFYPLLYSMFLQTTYSLNYLHVLRVSVWTETFVIRLPMPTILPYLGLLFQTYKNWLTHVIITLKMAIYIWG